MIYSDNRQPPQVVLSIWYTEVKSTKDNLETKNFNKSRVGLSDVGQLLVAHHSPFPTERRSSINEHPTSAGWATEEKSADLEAQYKPNAVEESQPQLGHTKLD